ncbi:hypothetical protein ACTMTI_19115 [Nonomuraea sp. H19]|uniref:hypothetical protein n=1 Tax=Nonomuraea sp. H19 TaxID=3452206 RepID=UPI003F8CDCA8
MRQRPDLLRGHGAGEVPGAVGEPRPGAFSDGAWPAEHPGEFPPPPGRVQHPPGGIGPDTAPGARWITWSAT